MPRSKKLKGGLVQPYERSYYIDPRSTIPALAEFLNSTTDAKEVYKVVQKIISPQSGYWPKEYRDDYAAFYADKSDEILKMLDNIEKGITTEYQQAIEVIDEMANGNMDTVSKAAEVAGSAIQIFQALKQFTSPQGLLTAGIDAYEKMMNFLVSGQAFTAPEQVSFSYREQLASELGGSFGSIGRIGGEIAGWLGELFGAESIAKQNLPAIKQNVKNNYDVGIRFINEARKQIQNEIQKAQKQKQAYATRRTEEKKSLELQREYEKDVFWMDRLTDTQYRQRFKSEPPADRKYISFETWKKEKYPFSIEGGMRKHNRKAKLHGEGFFSDLWYKTKSVSEAAVQRVRDVFKGVRDDYSPKVRKLLSQIGDNQVVSIVVRRDPVQKFLNTVLNFITLGKWNEMRGKFAYDKIFHLSLEVSVRLSTADNAVGRYVIEKNEVINVSPASAYTEQTETFEVPMYGSTTINMLLSNTRLIMGAKFFPYDAFNNNCQDFIASMLTANGLATPQILSVVKQPLEEVLKGLPGYTERVAKAVTDVAAVADVAIQGRGKKPIMIQKDFPTNYSQDAVDILMAMAFNNGEGLKIVGSMSVRSQEWAGDFDGFQVARLNKKTNEAAANDYVRQWKENIRKLQSMKNVYIGDIKCGTIEDWRVIPRNARLEDNKIVDYDYAFSQKRIKMLEEKGIISAEEAQNAKDMVKKSPSIGEFLACKQKLKFHIVRWTPDEILAGHKTLRDGSKFTLAKAIQTPIIGKMDVIGLVANSRFTDFSVIYEFRNKDKALNPDVINITQSLKEAITAYTEDGNFFKVLKRKYALARVQNDIEMVKKLTPILNSDLGRLYHIVGDIGTLTNLVKMPNVNMKRVVFQIDQFISRLSGIWTMADYLKDETNILDFIQKIKKQSKDEMGKSLDELGERLEAFLQAKTKEVVGKAKLENTKDDKVLRKPKMYGGFSPTYGAYLQAMKTGKSPIEEVKRVEALRFKELEEAGAKSKEAAAKAMEAPPALKAFLEGSERLASLLENVPIVGSVVKGIKGVRDVVTPLAEGRGKKKRVHRF